MQPAFQSPTLTRAHKMRFGAEVRERSTRFKLWAPKAKTVRLKLSGRRTLLELEPQDDGWHRLEVEGVGAGARYKFVLPDDSEIADPASRFQPDEVTDFSEVIDPQAFQWSDGPWAGRPWEEAIIYELHVGGFTPEGTFTAAAARLDHLVKLGVTAIQLMPLAEFYGKFNWGYDGVLWFAPSSAYGRPEDLKALVDAAHRLGLMVFVDVVYNHFGPVGNNWPAIAPIFTKAHASPWGEAINYDGKDSAVVRELAVENALYWMSEYNLDGLRFDAIQMVSDDSATHVLELLAARVRASQPGRHIHLIVENAQNQERWLRRGSRLEPVHFTAQWNDDIHHLLHSAATGENTGYYSDFDNLASRCDKLGRSLAEGFAYQGEYKANEGETRGQPSVGLPLTAFVAYIQNHDQIGNRIKGDRITELANSDAIKALASVYLLSPQIPMMFMGEEWAAKQPFPFFSDVPAEMREATRKGREKQLKQTPEYEDSSKPDITETVDATSNKTFLSAKLDWATLEQAEHHDWFNFYRTLIDLRRHEIVPRLGTLGGFASRHQVLGDNSVLVEWVLGDNSTLRLYLNLCNTTQENVPPVLGRRFWLQGFAEAGRLGPWTVLWTVDITGT